MPDDVSTDDEETIAQEETMDSAAAAASAGGSKTDHQQEEIDALKRESEMPLEDLLSQLPPDYFESMAKNDDAPTKQADHQVAISWSEYLVN